MRGILRLSDRLTSGLTHTPPKPMQVVMAAGGSIKYFVEAVFNAPTLAEAYNVAAQNGLRNMGINV